jgi:hypothetical protein
MVAVARRKARGALLAEHARKNPQSHDAGPSARCRHTKKVEEQMSRGPATHQTCLQERRFDLLCRSHDDGDGSLAIHGLKPCFERVGRRCRPALCNSRPWHNSNLDWHLSSCSACMSSSTLHQSYAVSAIAAYPLTNKGDACSPQTHLMQPQAAGSLCCETTVARPAQSPLPHTSKAMVLPR